MREVVHGAPDGKPAVVGGSVPGELRVGDASSTPWAEVTGERLHNAEAVASLERELAELGDADERRHRRHADCQYLLCTEDTDKWPEEAALRRAVLDACMAYHDKHQKQHWLAGTGQESAATLKILEQVREARSQLAGELACMLARQSVGKVSVKVLLRAYIVKYTFPLFFEENEKQCQK